MNNEYDNMFLESVYSMSGIDYETKKSIVSLRNECKGILMEAPLGILLAVVDVASIAWVVYDWLSDDKDDDTDDDSDEIASNGVDIDGDGKTSELKDDIEDSYNNIKWIYERAITVANHEEGGIDDKIKAIVLDKITPDILKKHYDEETKTNYENDGFRVRNDGQIEVTDHDKLNASLKKKFGIDENWKPVPGSEEQGNVFLKKIKDGGMDIAKVSPAVLLLNKDDSAYINPNGDASFIDKIKRIWNAAKSGTINVVDAAKQVVGTAVDSVSSTASSVANSIYDTVSPDPSEYPDPSIDIVEGYKQANNNIKHMMRCRLYRNEQGEVASIPDDKWKKLKAYVDEENLKREDNVKQVNWDIDVYNGRVPDKDMNSEDKKLLTGERKLGDTWNKKSTDEKKDETPISNQKAQATTGTTPNTEST